MSQAAPLPHAGSLAAWLLACRMRTLTAAIAPVAVGSACAAAAGGFAWTPALAALFGALFIQIGTNFANDLFDFKKGADTAERIGPARAAQLGLLTSTQLTRGILVAFGLATLAGVYLVTRGGWPLVAIGLASLAAGVLYTGGPYPLGYHGLGDVFVFAFFGFAAVCGTVLVQLGRVPQLAWWLALPVGALSTCVLVVNNVRDAATDARVGKRTLAVRWGRGFGHFEYAALVALAFAVPLGLALVRRDAWLLLPLATLPYAVVLWRKLVRAQGPAHNPLLGATARLLLLHSLLMALALVL